MELIIQTGKHQGKKIELAGQDCLIGRHESCKIRIASGEVSKQHCRLKHKPGGLHAKDLGSRNGTYVNDELLTEEVVLNVGDTLRVGPMSFLVAEPKTAPETATPKPKGKKVRKAKVENEDLIASWLSEGGDLGESGRDTTVIMPSPAAAGSESASAEPAEKSVVNDPLKSVKEKAEAIIRQFHQQNKG